MCIAISKAESVIIPKETLETCWKHNPDGAGFVYADSGVLHIKKGYMDFESFWNSWKDNQDRKAVIHFRIATHGETDAQNTHPFQVGKDLAFVHNGIITNVDTSSNKQLSDTNHFNSSILKKIYKVDTKFIQKDVYQELIEAYIGHSKLIFLDSSNKHTIINRQMGTQEEGVWYSNTSYKPRAAIKPYVPLAAPKVQPALAGSATLTIGSRVKIIGHPAIKGSGFISYFGTGLMIGVTMDNDRITWALYSSYVYPEGKKEAKYAFEKGDYVFRVGTDVFGEVIQVREHTCMVEFDEGNATKPYVMAVSKNSLRPWDDSIISELGV